MTDRIHRRRWTTEEDNLIRQQYEQMSAAEIGALVDRTEDAVWLRVRVLNLGKREVIAPWTEAERAELRTCYATEPPGELARRLGRTVSAVCQQARAMNLPLRRGRAVQSVVGDYFNVIDTTEKAYILGFLAADGNVMDNGQITFGLQAKDADLVRFVRDRLAPEAGLSIARRDGFVSFSVRSPLLAAGLAQWGIVPRKSRVLQWPASLGSMLRPFLHGYFDGDGSAYVCRGSNPANEYPGWSVCSGSEQFLIDMKAYIQQQTGVVMEKIQHRPKSSLYQVSTTGRGAYVLDRWLHQEDGLGLARKRPPERVMLRYDAPPRPTSAEILASAVRATGSVGLTRKQISVEVFSCNKTSAQLDAIMAEVLSRPGFRVERRRTVGKASAQFLFCTGE
jgi:hypothetical protein